MAATLTLSPEEVERRVHRALLASGHPRTVRQAPQTAAMMGRYWHCWNLELAGEEVGVHQSVTSHRLARVLAVMGDDEVTEGLLAIRAFGHVPRAWRSGREERAALTRRRAEQAA